MFFVGDIFEYVKLGRGWIGIVLVIWVFFLFIWCVKFVDVIKVFGYGVVNDDWIYFFCCYELVWYGVSFGYLLIFVSDEIR